MAATTIAPFTTPIVNEQPDQTHEQLSRHDAEMEMLADMRYEHGIDNGDNRYL